MITALKSVITVAHPLLSMSSWLFGTSSRSQGHAANQGGYIAAVAALAGGASAHAHRRAHEALFRRGAHQESVCVPSCTTIYTTIYGEPTLVPNKPTPKPTSSAAPTTSAAPVPTTSKVPEVPLPTPIHNSCPTPGTYTFPATTVTVSETTTVCVPETTKVPSGTHTVGGVTTVVVTATTVTCPVATVITSGTVTTSTIVNTEYVCPSAGTYTIGPITTTVDKDTDVVYPVPTSYLPGTYTAPEKVVTVTETDYVYVCPFTSSGIPAPTAAPEPAPAPPAPKPEAPKVEAPKPEAPKPQPTQEAPKPKPTQEAPKEQPKGGELKGTKDHYGITYTPYEASTGNCKDANAVDSDIKSLKEAGFDLIRIYSTDCNTLETVGPAAKKYDVNLILGVFVKASGCSYDVPEVKEQVDSLAAWAEWDRVKLFVVGNEAIMNNFCSPQQLASLITIVKSKCSGYKGPYTIAETLNIWQRTEVSSAICGVVDVTGANIHPYFNGQVTPETAGDFVQGQLDLLADICKGNDVINLECGWPTKGVCNGSACPGVQEQATAIKSIREKCGNKTVFFSVENDMWKEPGACGCEQSWGCKSVFV
ncbi:putative beta-glucosidase btgE [Paramyrothecium foliicola]|nr:putative beta-glucosidase btgE [Paramyrothecium foliicola]